MPDVTDSGFALMSDWPGVEECAAFFLPFQSKLCDLLSCWMAAAEELGQPSSKPHRVIQLSYRNRCACGREGGMEGGRVEKERGREGGREGGWRKRGGGREGGRVEEEGGGREGGREEKSSAILM